MERKEFEKMIEAYGANATHWPADTRVSAEDFATSKEGAETLRAAQVLDKSLNLVSAPAPASQDFLSRLQALPQQVKIASSKSHVNFLQKLRWRIPELSNWLRPGALSAQGTAFATALILGVWVGGQEAVAEQTPFDEELALLELTPQADRIVEDLLVGDMLEESEQ